MKQKLNNIIDYIKWRGDLEFSFFPFNDVDNLIFSIIAYIDFADLIPTVESNQKVSAKEVFEKIIKENHKQTNRIKYLLPLPFEFIEELAKSQRFNQTQFFNYTDIVDSEKNLQFSALHIQYQPNQVYIAFRGTDRTITGWREDFYMSFETVKAQLESVQYLNKTINKKTHYRIGGHSKGGNLSVFSSIFCEDRLKSQILQIYNNDGPGLSKEIITSSQYNLVGEKISMIVPEHGIIGLLFNYDAPLKIVKSSQIGLLQHDAFSWIVEKDRFYQLAQLSPESQQINQILDTWLENVETEEKKIFIDHLFDSLEASGATELTGIADKGIIGLQSIFNSIIQTDKVSKKVLKDFVRIANQQTSIEKINSLLVDKIRKKL